MEELGDTKNKRRVRLIYGGISHPTLHLRRPAHGVRRITGLDTIARRHLSYQKDETLD